MEFSSHPKIAHDFNFYVVADIVCVLNNGGPHDIGFKGVIARL